MKYIITGSDYTSELFSDLQEDINLISMNDIEKFELTFAKGDLCYVPSESALSKVVEAHTDEDFKNKVMQLKDKVKFRELMAKFYPDFFFKKVALKDLDKVELDPNKKFIAKPVRGFFGTGVYEINPGDCLKDIQQKFYDEVAEKSRFFSDSILSTEEIIIETFAEGQEYAIDMYYDDEGNPQIVNIYHHPFPEKFSYFHVLYYTGEEIFKKYLDKITNFFVEMNKVYKATNFPIHAEFKIENDVMVPIEMNPLRYGGFGLGDLTFHAFDINPFAAYFNNMKIDWEKIWESRIGEFYAWILAYNGDNVDLEKQIPDYEKFENFLTAEMIHNVKMNYKENPVFAIAYQKSKNFADFSKLLKVEFNEFFKNN